MQAHRLQCVAATSTTVLTADVGGTNARYQVHTIDSAGAPVLAFEKARCDACAAEHRNCLLTHTRWPQTYQTSEHPTFEGSLAALLHVSGRCVCIPLSAPAA